MIILIQDAVFKLIKINVMMGQDIVKLMHSCSIITSVIQRKMASLHLLVRDIH